MRSVLVLSDSVDYAIIVHIATFIDIVYWARLASWIAENKMSVGHKSLVAHFMIVAGANLIYLFVAPLALPRRLVYWFSQKQQNLSSMRKEPANHEKCSNRPNMIVIVGLAAEYFFLAVYAIPVLLISVIVEFEKWVARIAIPCIPHLRYLGIPTALHLEGNKLEDILFGTSSFDLRRTIKITGLGERNIWVCRCLGFTTIRWSRLHKPDDILRAEVLAAAIAIDSDAHMHLRNVQLSFSTKHLLTDIWHLRSSEALVEEKLCFEFLKISIWSGSRRSFNTFRMINHDFAEPMNEERKETPASPRSIWSARTARDVTAVVSLQEGRDLITTLAYSNEILDKLRQRPVGSRSVTHRGKRTLTVVLSALINLVASRVVLGTWNAIGHEDRTVKFQFAVLSLALTTIWLNILSKELFGPIKEDEEDVLRRTPNRRIVEILAAASDDLSRTFRSAEEEEKTPHPCSCCDKSETITLRHTPMDWLLAGLGIDEATGAVVSLYGKESPDIKPPAAGDIDGLTFIDNSVREENTATDGDDLVDLDIDESPQVAQNSRLQNNEELSDSEFDSPV